MLAVEARFCEQCVSLKPLAEFRRRARGGAERLNQCRDCHNRAERQRRAQRRSDQDRLRIAGQVARLARERDHQRLERLCAAMFAEYGGVQGLVAVWTSHCRRAMAQGGMAAMRCLESVVRVLQCCEANRTAAAREEAARIGAMSDEDLRRAFGQSVGALIEQRPELAVDAALALGWTLLPPQAG